MLLPCQVFCRLPWTVKEQDRSQNARRILAEMRILRAGTEYSLVYTDIPRSEMDILRVETGSPRPETETLRFETDIPRAGTVVSRVETEFSRA